MDRRDATYKLAREFAKTGDYRVIEPFLVKHKDKLKGGKADAILQWFIDEKLGIRGTQSVLSQFVDGYERANSYKGYEEIKGAFRPGLSTFQGTIYLKKNAQLYEDFDSCGLLIGLVINCPEMSDSISIKTDSGFNLNIKKGDEKATMFIISDVNVPLPYNISTWERSSLYTLASDNPLGSIVLDRARRRNNELEGERDRGKTPLQVFLETRTMNLNPSKRQLAKIRKQKKKVFGPELEEEFEGPEEYVRPRGVDILNAARQRLER